MSTFYAQYPQASTSSGANASVGPTGASVPADATFVGGQNPGGNLQGFLVDASGFLEVSIGGSVSNISVNLAQVGGAAISEGQKLMAASLPVVIASDQSDVGVNIDKYGGVATTLGQKVMASSIPIAIASDQTPIPTGSPVNTNGSQVTDATVGSGGASSYAPPANAVGFIIEASSSNTPNLRWKIGAAATTTTGMRLEPGRDSGFVPCAATISVIAESGAAQEIQIQWILSS